MSALTNFLKSVTVFQDLDDKGLDLLVSLLATKKYKAGQIIFREKDPADALYVVQQGQVVLSKHVMGDVDHVLTRFGQGEFFGEMGLFDSEPRSASAQTEEDAVLLALDRDVFQKLLAERPDMAARICYRLVMVFVRRLRATNEQAREAVRWGLEATGYTALEG